MAFLRFMRDKRGYEHFSLVEATTNRRGKSRTRLLYWYRTPPNVRVGREPFDESVRRALEAQNPGVQFDWRKIVETPIPSAETERWRERRRAEKAEKAARRAAVAIAVPGHSVVPEEPADSDEFDEPVEESADHEDIEDAEPLTAAPEFEEAAEQEAAHHEATNEESTEAPGDVVADADRAASADADRAAPVATGHMNTAGRRRRRRRGRRGRSGPASSTPQSSPDSAGD